MQVAIVFRRIRGDDRFPDDLPSPEIIGVFLTEEAAQRYVDNIFGAYIELHNVQDSPRFNPFPVF